MNKESRLLAKSEREACIPTEEELRNYLATPDDGVAAKLRKELSPESFGKIGFIILYTEKIEKAQDTKSVKVVIDELQGILQDWDKWTDEEGGEEKWQAKYGCDTTDLISVFEEKVEALKGGIDEQ